MSEHNPTQQFPTKEASRAEKIVKPELPPQELASLLRGPDTDTVLRDNLDLAYVIDYDQMLKMRESNKYIQEKYLVPRFLLELVQERGGTYDVGTVIMRGGLAMHEILKVVSREEIIALYKQHAMKGIGANLEQAYESDENIAQLKEIVREMINSGLTEDGVREKIQKEISKKLTELLDTNPDAWIAETGALSTQIERYREIDKKLWSQTSSSAEERGTGV